MNYFLCTKLAVRPFFMHFGGIYHAMRIKAIYLPTKKSFDRASSFSYSNYVSFQISSISTR